MFDIILEKFSEFGNQMSPNVLYLVFIPLIYIGVLGIKYKYPEVGEPIWNQTTKFYLIRIWMASLLIGLIVSVIMSNGASKNTTLAVLLVSYGIPPLVIAGSFLVMAKIEMEKREKR